MRCQSTVAWAVAAALTLATPTFANDASVTLTAGQVTTILPQPNHHRYFERVINVSTSGTAWCSRYDTAPAPHKAGSFPIAPFGNSLGLPSAEEFQAAGNTLAGFVPQRPLSCTADTGTASLTVEYEETGVGSP